MIFNENYDKVLWLMLLGNKNNSERIIEFIKSIPDEFLPVIQNTIEEYNKYRLENNSSLNVKNRCFNGEFNDGREYIYCFSIDNESGLLLLGRCSYEYGVYFNDFEMKLSSYVDNNQIDIFSKQKLGEISFDYRHVNNGDVVYLGESTNYNYVLVKLPSKYLVLSYDDDMSCLKTRMNIVDNIPNDYEINDTMRLVKRKNNDNKRKNYDI